MNHVQISLTGFQSLKEIYDTLLDTSSQEIKSGISAFPGTVIVRNHSPRLPSLAASMSHFSVSLACSLHGSPSVQRWYFALQACQQVTQVRHFNVQLIVVLVVSRRGATFCSDRLESSCDQIFRKLNYWWMCTRKLTYTPNTMKNIYHL